MFYKIREISTVRGRRLTYILVDFWRTRDEFALGHSPVLTNDFLMELRSTVRRIVVRVDGWLQLVDGSYVNPNEEDTHGLALGRFKRETVAVDLPAQIKENVEAYWERAVTAGITGDHTANALKPLYREGKIVAQRPTASIKRDKSDPAGVLARQDVKDLVGIELEMRP